VVLIVMIPMMSMTNGWGAKFTEHVWYVHAAVLVIRIVRQLWPIIRLIIRQFSHVLHVKQVPTKLVKAPTLVPHVQRIQVPMYKVTRYKTAFVMQVSRESMGGSAQRVLQASIKK